jgi:hypothetical protein
MQMDMLTFVEKFVAHVFSFFFFWKLERSDIQRSEMFSRTRVNAVLAFIPFQLNTTSDFNVPSVCNQVLQKLNKSNAVFCKFS